MSVNVWNATEQKLEQVSGNVNINDSVISENSTFSSQKIHDSLVDLESALESTVKNPNGLTYDANRAFSNATTNNGKTLYYRCNANTPNSGFWWNIESTTSDVNGTIFIHQRATMCSSGDTRVYIRQKNGDTWSAWQELATMDKVRELLWTNPDTTKPFASTNLTIDLSKHDIVLVCFMYSNESGGMYRFSKIMKRMSDNIINAPGTKWSSDIYGRNLTLNSSTIVISDCWKVGDTTGTFNIHCIPEYIYGL